MGQLSMKRAMLVLSLFLFGCDTGRHGVIAHDLADSRESAVNEDKNLIGISEEELYRRFGHPVIHHPIDKNTVFYFSYVDLYSIKAKFKWYMITITNGKVTKVHQGSKEGKMKNMVPHIKPKFVKKNWTEELFGYIGSAS
ncbi:MAG: hypothetical protein H6845_00915 [Alphaproteobacteria bacterium]|nr:MAG: hypothetical protein H6845_00915 [Alphaproteobacteria bacterium]